MLASMRLCATVPMQRHTDSVGWISSINEFILPGGRLLEQRNKAYEMINQEFPVSVALNLGAMYMFPKIDTEMYNIHDDERICV